MRFASLFTLYKTEVREIVRGFNRNGVVEPDTIRYALVRGTMPLTIFSARKGTIYGGTPRSGR